jgi:RNA polymerase subunit RPABC4/transcription elongation factor Spt4
MKKDHGPMSACRKCKGVIFKGETACGRCGQPVAGARRAGRIIMTAKDFTKR